jgi:hypothetical protein
MNYGIRSKVFSQWRNLSEQLVVDQSFQYRKVIDGIIYVLRTEDVNGKCFQKNTDLVLPVIAGFSNGIAVTSSKRDGSDY